MTWVLVDDGEVLTDDDGTPNTFDTRAAATAKKEEIGSLFGDLEVEQQGVEEVEADVIDMSADGGNNTDSDDDNGEIEDDEKTMGLDVCVHCGNDINDGHCPDCGTKGKRDTEQPGDVPESAEVVEAIETVKDGGLDTDPLSILPDFMKDPIKGSVAVNKRGYAMIAERYDIEVSTEMVESPWDNDEGRVVCKATAITDDGKTYNAYGTACADDDDDSAQLIELADTRSQKRAVQWASGFGIVSYAEMANSLEEGA